MGVSEAGPTPSLPTVVVNGLCLQNEVVHAEDGHSELIVQRGQVQKVLVGASSRLSRPILAKNQH